MKWIQYNRGLSFFFLIFRFHNSEFGPPADALWNTRLKVSPILCRPRWLTNHFVPLLQKKPIKEALACVLHRRTKPLRLCNNSSKRGSQPGSKFRFWLPISTKCLDQPAQTIDWFDFLILYLPAFHLSSIPAKQMIVRRKKQHQWTFAGRSTVKRGFHVASLNFERGKRWPLRSNGAIQLNSQC